MDKWVGRRMGEAIAAGERHTTIVLAVITNHKHHLPLEDIVVHKPAGDPG